MTVMEATATVTIRLEADCLDDDCAALGRKMHDQLGTAHYSRGASVMAIPGSVEAWRADHRTARKRADRAARLGYTFAEIDRSQHNDDIHSINTSLAQRQGRPMSDGYLTRHNHGALPHYPCPRHAIHTYGVLAPATIPGSASSSRRAGGRQGEADPTLVAYLNAYRIGDLLMVSMILGHADHLANDCMYALWQGVVGDQAHHGGVAYYNLWNSGEDGLRYFKSKLGFTEADIEWVL